MQIELIGCTGAGKSTLAGGIVRACRREGLDILLSEEFVLKQLRLNWVHVHPIRKLLVNLAGLSASLATWRKNWRFYLFSTQLLFEVPIPRLERIHLLRNVLKKIGIYEIIQFRRVGQQIIVVDEGVLQAAHNLFVHVAVDVEPEHLSTFARLVSLPDVVVYLKQPEGVLIERTMKRGHQRIPDHSYAKVVRFVRQAVSVFDEVVKQPAIKNKVLVIDGNRGAVMSANGQDSRILSLASAIVRSGLPADVSRQPSGRSSVEQSS